MKNSLKTTKITFTVIMIISILVVGLAVYTAIENSRGSSGRKPTPTTAPSPSATQAAVKTEGDTTTDVLVLKVKTAESVIRVYSPERDEIIELNYSGSTDIKNRFDQVLSASLIESGTIAEVSYDRTDNRLYHLYISKDSWKIEEPLSWEIRTDNGIMRVGDRNYRIKSNVVTFAGDEEFSVLEISDMDVINVYGKDSQVFAIELVLGHGTIYAMNEDEFIGGSFFVDNVYAGQITEGFALSIREGSYEVSFSRGDLNGKESIVMNKNGTVVVNMKPYTEETVEYGYVEFIIQPEDASLFIDSFKYDASEPVKLQYGSHNVEIMRNGYTTWSGTIVVGTPSLKHTITLAEINYAPTPTPTPEITEEPEEPTPTEAAQITPTEGAATPTPDGSLTPTPTPAGEPDDSTSEKEKEITFVWYPSSVITVDSVYVGTTDGGGTLTVKVGYGNHVIGCTRTVLDGETTPETYTVTVNADTSPYISFPTR